MLKDECAAVGIHLFQTSTSAVDSTMLEVPESAIKHMTYVSITRHNLKQCPCPQLALDSHHRYSHSFVVIGLFVCQGSRIYFFFSVTLGCQ